jgi:hypothetical protein
MSGQPEIDAAVRAIRRHVPTIRRYGTRADREGLRAWVGQLRAWGLRPLDERYELAVRSGASEGRLLTLKELHALPRVLWLVEGWTPELALAVLFGPSGIGKGFIVLALVMGHLVPQHPPPQLPQRRASRRIRTQPLRCPGPGRGDGKPVERASIKPRAVQCWPGLAPVPAAGVVWGTAGG